MLLVSNLGGERVRCAEGYELSAEGRASPLMPVNLSTTLSTGLTSYPQGQSGQTIGAELYKANGKVKG